MQSFLTQPHRRYNSLTGEWVLVSPHRTARPWQGKKEDAASDTRPEYDPKCYLCPGNERAGGHKNPKYDGIFVFENDFAALLPADGRSIEDTGLFVAEQVSGTCRVICFSPHHNLSLPQMDVADIRKVADMWADQYEELSQKYRWVQIFENKGAVMGCSNPHPHGQIWASSSLPNEPAKEELHQSKYFESKSGIMLLDYLHQEIDAQERIVYQNEHWAALVPWWGIWPFEMMLIPKRHVRVLPELSDSERSSLASILKKTLTAYDELFETSFPYSMGWHGDKFEHWQLHAHFYPPLLRSATVKKFLVGYEMLGEVQRDITPEAAAERIREVLK